MNSSEQLKKIIEDMGVTYSFISKKTGYSVDMISRSLMGKRKLRADELIVICSSLNINMKELQRNFKRESEV